MIRIRMLLVWSSLMSCFALLGCSNSERKGDRESLKQICDAICSYRDEYGYYPPSQVRDSAGNPLHSWRLLVLPYLEANSIFGRYNFSQAWNSESNLELNRFTENDPKMNVHEVFCGKGSRFSHAVLLLPRSPVEMKLPSSLDSASTEFTAWEATYGDRIVVLWLDPTSVNWLEPRDVSIDELSENPNLIKSIQFAIIISSTSKIDFLNKPTIHELISIVK